LSYSRRKSIDVSIDTNTFFEIKKLIERKHEQRNIVRSSKSDDDFSFADMFKAVR